MTERLQNELISLFMFCTLKAHDFSGNTHQKFDKTQHRETLALNCVSDVAQICLDLSGLAVERQPVSARATRKRR